MRIIVRHGTAKAEPDPAGYRALPAWSLTWLTPRVFQAACSPGGLFGYAVCPPTTLPSRAGLQQASQGWVRCVRRLASLQSSHGKQRVRGSRRCPRDTASAGASRELQSNHEYDVLVLVVPGTHTPMETNSNSYGET